MFDCHLRPCHWSVLIALPLALACRDATNVPSASAQQPTRASADVSAALSDLTPEMVVGGGGLRLAVYDRGNAGGTPIVLIHGFTGSCLSWQPQLTSDLAKDFRLIAYDFRGHGASEKPIDPAKYSDGTLWADDLNAVIREKHLDHPVLVGWSYAGYVIADYVRRYGDTALGGVVFVGAVTKAGTPEANRYFTDDALAVFPKALSADVLTSVDATRELTRMFANPFRGPAWERSYGTAMMVPPAVRVGMWSRVLDNDDVLARMRVPTLVVQGSADRIVRGCAAAHIAATVPGAKLIVYPGVGHAVQLDAPERLNRDVAIFVRAPRRNHP